MRLSAVLFGLALFTFSSFATPLAGAKTPLKHHPVSHARKHYASHARHVVRVAPADEYFGRMKMSILGIRNQLRDLALRLQYSPDKSEDVLGSARWVEDAMHDWEHKYPGDPWLAKSVYDLTSLYSNVHTDHGQAKAQYALHWLLVKYGHTRYGQQARVQYKPQIVTLTRK